MRRASLVVLLVPLAGLLMLPDAPGGVVEGADGPLGGVPVRYKAGDVFATTDAVGRFRLPFGAQGKSITAARDGHFIAGLRVGATPAQLTLHPLPTEDNQDYAWVDPTPSSGDTTRCGHCHGTIHQEWRAGGHSRSATSQAFLNHYARLLDERPDGAGVCASCHAPAVRDDDPALFDLRQLAGVAAHGVHCDYCHKIAGQAGGEIGLTHGRFLARLLRPREGQLFFGPLDDVDRGEDAYSPFYRDSRYCAACHEGVVFGVRVYGTYSEWLDSPAGKAGLHCQHCHMRPTGRLTNLAPGRGGVERDPHTLGNHTFWDGSQLDMLRKALRAWVRIEGARVRVEVVAEGVGHRVPTGFVERQVILVVEGRDVGDNSVSLTSGPRLPRDVGQPLAGLPGRVFGRDRGRVPFWLAAREAADTRLRPGVPEAWEFRFSNAVAAVRVRLLHRRLWGDDPRHDLVIRDDRMR